MITWHQLLRQVEPHLSNMKKYTVAFLFFCVLLEPAQVFAQQFNFQVYAVNKGLPQSQVHDIEQTKDGYIWLATYGGGLAKFDGKTFVNYTTDDGLKDNLVEEVFVDSKDNIWVSTDKGGVAKFQDDSLFYPIKNDSLNKYFISGIMEHSNGSMWFGSYEGGVFIYEDQKVRRLTIDDGLPSNIAWNFFEAKDGKVWIGTGDGVSIYDGKKFKNYSTEDGLSGKKVYNFAKTSDGKIWLATSDGLSIWDGNSFRSINAIDGTALNGILDVIEASDGTVWMASRSKGIFTFEDGQFTHITEENGLSSNYIYELFEDRNKQIWIGTDENGANLYKENGFLFYNKETGLSTNEILSIQRDDQENFWLGTTEGIELFNSKTFHSRKLSREYQDLNIWNITKLPNGNKLINLPDKLVEFDGKSFSNFSKEYNLGELFIYDLMVDSSNELWIGAVSGLYNVNLQTKTIDHYSTEDGLANERVFHIYEDREGRKWIGTYYGLSLFDGENFKTFRIQDGLVHNQVNYVTQDKKGDIWVGTRGGISVLELPQDGEKIEIGNFDKDDGMTLLNTHFLWFDNKGFLWQGTNAGLQKLDVPYYRNTGKMSVTHYPLSNEGIGLEFNFHALSTEGNQQAWMGSMGGVVQLQPEKLSESRLLGLNITDIKVNTSTVSWTDYTKNLHYHNGQIDFPSVTFPSDKNIFEFSFKGISFSNPEDIKYRYMLKGFKDEWMPITGGNSAVFTNLHPGDYTFVVQAKHSGNQFSENVAEYNFALAYPFWRTYWFYAMVLAALIGFIYGYIRFQVNKIEKNRLQELVDEQTEYLTEALKEKEVLIKEIHHRVKNNLAVISGLLELQMGHNNNEYVNRTLSESQRRVRSIAMIHEKLYQNKRLAEINFEKYVRELVDIVAYSFNYSQKKINVKVDIHDFKLGVDQGIPCGLILNELISNAYEHAFKNQDTGTINIQIAEDENRQIELIIEDNGNGFPENFDVAEQDTLGLTLIDTLCKQLQGNYHYENTGPGTRFVLTFKKEAAKPTVPT